VITSRTYLRCRLSVDRLERQHELDQVVYLLLAQVAALTASEAVLAVDEQFLDRRVAAVVQVYWFTVNRSIGLCVGGSQGYMNWKALR